MSLWTWWIWYLLGIITIFVVAALVWLLMALTEEGFCWKCRICGKEYHWEPYGRPDGRWLFKELSWQWHKRVGCTVRGRKKRLAWVDKNLSRPRGED